MKMLCTVCCLLVVFSESPLSVQACASPGDSSGALISTSSAMLSGTSLFAFVQQPSEKKKNNQEGKGTKKGGMKPPAGSSGSSSQMPAGYPGLGGKAPDGSKQPPPGSSMQPPDSYPTSGNPYSGKGGTTPPPGSSLSSSMGSMPGYGTGAPKMEPGTPPPGSSSGIQSGRSEKPRDYPTNNNPYAGGPPPGSSMGPPNAAYANKMKPKPPPTTESAKEELQKKPDPQPTAKIASPASKPPVLPIVAATRLLSEYKTPMCSLCGKSVSTNDESCPNCKAKFTVIVNPDGTRTELAASGTSRSAFAAGNSRMVAIGVGVAVMLLVFVIGIVAAITSKQTA